MTDAKKAYISDGVNWLPLVSSLPNMNGYATEDYVNIKIDEVENIILPDQYGNDGKFLSTDGTNASWEIIDLSPYATQSFANNAALTASVAAVNTASAAAVSYLVDSAPATLDTLNELAAALNDDANFASTVTTALGTKLNISTASSTYLTQSDATSTYAPKVSPSLSGSVSMSGSIAVTGTMSVRGMVETVTIPAGGATSLERINIIDEGPIKFFNSAGSINVGVDIRGNATTTLNSIMSIGQSVTVVFMMTNSSPAYYVNELSIDGSFVNRTLRWQGGVAPTSGNANSVDAYSFTIIKTANNTFSVFASQTRFA